MTSRADTSQVSPSAGADALAESVWRRRLRFARQVYRGVVGADAYDVYLEHQRRVHPDEPALCRKDFWREKTDRLDKNPQARCC